MLSVNQSDGVADDGGIEPDSSSNDGSGDEKHSESDDESEISEDTCDPERDDCEVIELNAFFAGADKHVIKLKCSACSSKIVKSDNTRCCFMCNVAVCENCAPTNIKAEHNGKSHKVSKLMPLEKLMSLPMFNPPSAVR